jgi:hypothetical protein
MTGNAGVFNLSGVLQRIGLGPGSPNNWSDYPALSLPIQEALSSIITPFAFKALHYHPESFQKVYALQRARFEEIPIFRINSSSVNSRETELQGFTVLQQGGSLVDMLESDTARSAYRSVFENSRIIVSRNHCVATNNVRRGNTQDIDSLVNMAFAFSVRRDRQTSHTTLMGFYPYFSTRDDALGEYVFFFFHAELDTLVLISTPLSERDHGLNFILTHGALHTFDKVCARCGKTGELLKCGCRKVRYCGKECQMEHWGLHKAECRLTRESL